MYSNSPWSPDLRLGVIVMEAEIFWNDLGLGAGVTVLEAEPFWIDTGTSEEGPCGEPVSICSGGPLGA